MEVFSSLEDCALACLEKHKPIHLAIGIFDGVHLGHQALLQQMPLGAPNSSCGILSFSPHPSRIVRPQEPTLLWMPYFQQEKRLAKLGLDFIIRHPFDTTLAHTLALDFLQGLIYKFPNLKGIYVGQAFRFGYKRQGDRSLLESWGANNGVAIKALATLKKGGSPLSSSRLRGLIAKADFAAVKALLGYGYCAEGKLQGRPHQPYIQWQPELAPPPGLYRGYLPDLDLHTTLNYKQGYIYLNKTLIQLASLPEMIAIEFLEKA